MHTSKSLSIKDIGNRSSILFLTSILVISFIIPKALLAQGQPVSYPTTEETPISYPEVSNTVDQVVDNSNAFSEYSQEELDDATAKVKEALIAPSEDNFFVVKFKDEESANRVSQEVAPEDVISERYTSLLGDDVRLIKIDNEEEKIDQMTKFNLDNDVEYVETNQIVKKESWTTTSTTAKPNDFNNANHWYHLKTKLPETFKDEGCPTGNSCGGSNTLIVAILDTGMAFETNTGATYREYLGGSPSNGINRTPLNFVPSPELTGITVWTNPAENYTGLDEDGNFICDDLHGADMVAVIDNLSMKNSAQWQASCDNVGDADHAWVEKEGHPNDDDGHGTFVANMIASLIDNATSSFGTAFKTKIMPIKVLDYTGTGSTFTIAQGIRYAVNNGAKIINISIAGLTSPSATLEDAINYANTHGVLLIISSGNQALSSLEYPAAYTNSYSNVIAVGASNTSDTKASYSSYGTGLDLVAPVGTGASAGNATFGQTFNDADSWNVAPLVGRDFTTFGNKYWIGTSFAAPQVTSASALLWAEYSNLTPSLIKSYLRSSATDVGTAGYDTQTGYGIVNIKLARDQVSLGVGFPWIMSGGTTGDIYMVDLNNKLFQTVVDPQGFVWTRTTNSTDTSNNPLWTAWVMNGRTSIGKVAMTVSNNKIYQSVSANGQMWTRYHTSGNVDGSNNPVWGNWIQEGNTPYDISLVDLNNRLYQSFIDSSGVVWVRTTDGTLNGSSNPIWSSAIGNGITTTAKTFTAEANSKLFQSLVANGLVYTRVTDGTLSSGNPVWSNWVMSGGTTGEVYLKELSNKMYQVVLASGDVWTRTSTGSIDGSNNPIWTGWIFNGKAATPRIEMAVSNTKLYQSVVAQGTIWTRFTTGSVDGSGNPVWNNWAPGVTDASTVYMADNNGILFQSTIYNGFVYTRTTDGTLDVFGNPTWTNWVFSGGTDSPTLKVYMTASNGKLFQAVVKSGQVWTRYFIEL